jgi:hypothetical protein
LAYLEPEMDTARREAFPRVHNFVLAANVASDIVHPGESAHTLIAPMGDSTCSKRGQFYAGTSV